MRRARTAIGALALCALALGVVGAGGAAASGLTAVTCTEVEPGTSDFSTDHCETPGVEAGDFATTPVSSGTKVTGTSANPSFSMTFALVKINVDCEQSVGTGEVTQKKAAK